MGGALDKSPADAAASISHRAPGGRSAQPVFASALATDSTEERPPFGGAFTHANTKGGRA